MTRTGRENTIILRARTVLPVSRPPLDNGAVAITGGRISAVGPWQRLASRGDDCVDLGEVILLPGMINAHCHLDYTHMAGEIAAPRTFTGWLKLITANKSGWLYSDFAASWITGAKMLLRNGTTTVGDVEMVPDLLPEVWTATPLRVISCLEMTGVIRRRPPAEILGEAETKIESLPRSRCATGFSPHAPYSTAPGLLRLTAAAARRRRCPMVTHLAESDEEFDMFTHGRGELFEWLTKNGRDMADCGLGTPVQHYERHGALNKNVLAVHANCLGPGDADLLSRRKVSVAHCPRSHSYFNRPPFPLAELTRAGVNVCLGTDSLASVHQVRKKPAELDMFAELRQFAEAFPALAPRTVLQMATVNGARALGLAGKVGELSARAYADLIAIPFTGATREAYEGVLAHRGLVAASMIAGEWAIRP